MFRFVGLCFGMLVRFFRERRSLLLENLALRQQLVALKRRHPRPSLGLFDKLFWVIARWVWSAWKHSLILVTPETVVRWHRTGFRIYWRLISRVRRPVGRRPTPKEVRDRPRDACEGTHRSSESRMPRRRVIASLREIPRREALASESRGIPL